MQMPNTLGYQAYQRNKYETASPHRLVLLLFEGAISNLHQAQKSLEQLQYMDMNKKIRKAQDIVCELLACLNEELGGEVAQNLKQLYLYMNNQLLLASIRKSEDILKEVTGLLQDLKTSWEQIGREVSLG